MEAVVLLHTMQDNTQLYILLKPISMQEPSHVKCTYKHKDWETRLLGQDYMWFEGKEQKRQTIPCDYCY